MSDFEKKYYENEKFWAGEMLQDPDNMRRFEATAKLIPNDVKSIADVGCGNGVFVNYLSQLRPDIDITGVDRSNTALKYVKVKKQNAEIQQLPFNNKSFDCVSCLEVIEHLPQTIYHTSLAELARVSKKYIIISVPFNEKLEHSYNKCPGCKSIFNYELHLRNYSEDGMGNLLKEFGFECINLQKLGRIENYIGHYLFRKIFYPKQILRWNSPICPICGFSKKTQEHHITAKTNSNKRSLVSYFTVIPKLFWPKKARPYWIMGLYKKTC